MQGINAISPTGRALQAATDKMTSDQQMQYLMQQQQSGVPLTPDLAMMMIQLNRLKQAKPPTPPPTQTVKQELNSGVASLPVPNQMYEPRGMAGGGIVAFAGGGAGRVMVPGDLGIGQSPVTTASAADLGLTPEQAKAFERVHPSKRAQWLAKHGSKLKTAGKGIVSGMALASVGNAFSPPDVENIRKYYAEKGLPVDTNMNNYHPWGDAGLRGLNAVQKTLTMGLTGAEDPATAVSAATAAPKKEKPPKQEDLAKYMQGLTPEGAPGGRGSFGYSGMGDVDVSGAFRPVYSEIERARKNTELKPEAEYIAEEKAKQQAAGRGQNREKYRGQIAEEMAKMPAEKRRDAWLSAANAFFKMGEAGGRTGSLAGAASEGAQLGLQQYGDVLTRQKLEKQRHQDKQFQLGEADEAAAAADIAAGGAKRAAQEGKVERLDAEARAARMAQSKAQMEVSMKEAELRVQAGIAKLVSEGRQGSRDLERAYNKVVQDPKLDAAQRASLMNQLLDAIQRLEKASNYQYDLGQNKLAADAGPLGAVAPAASQFRVLGKE